MTEQRLRDLLHHRAADVAGPDFAEVAWASATRIRRRRTAAALASAAALVIAAGTVTVAVRSSNNSDPVPAPASPVPTSTAEAVAADARVRGVPVWWSPSPAEESMLPWLDTALPRELDVAEAAASAPSSDTFNRALAAVPFPDTHAPRWMVLVAPDQSIARLDVSRLVPFRDVNAAQDVALRTSLSPDGRRLAFAQEREVVLYDLGSRAWSRLQTGPLAEVRIEWADDQTLLLRPEGARSGTLMGLDGTVLATGHVAHYVQILESQPPFSDPHGPLRTNSAGIEAVAWEDGTAVPAAPGERTGGFLEVKNLQNGPVVLAFNESDSAPRPPVKPVVVGWLDAQTVVYESASAGHDLLIAWRTGTREFHQVMKIDPPDLGTFVGGASFADLQTAGEPS